jgi:hypothetical protein
MRTPRLSAFSLIQLIVTVVAVLFGVYGVISAGEPSANAPVVANLPQGLEPAGGSNPCSPLETPAQPRPRPRPADPTPEQPLPPVTIDPDDSGNATLKGSVKYTDGRAVEGMKITAISTGIEPAAPQWDPSDIPATRKAYERYFRELERNTRVTFTDATGRFDLSGLAEGHSYRVTATSAEVGESRQVVRAGGRADFQFDVPSLLDGVVTTDSGSLPRQWSVTVSIDNGQGWFEHLASANFSDAEGKFRIRAKAAKLMVSVYAPGWVQDKNEAFELKSEGGSVQVRLLKAAALSGTVTSTDASPMPSVSVYVNGAGQGNDYSGKPRGEWGLRDGLELEERLEAVQHLKELEERVRSDELIEPGYFPGELWSGMSGYTDASGKYRIEGLRPGKVTVTVTMGAFTDSREITLVGGENYADFSLDAGCRIKIVGRDTGNNPVTPQYAWFIDAQGQYGEAVQLPAGVKGELEYMGLKEGTWNMTVQAQGFPNLTQEVQVRRGSNTVDVVFQTPASLKGKVSSMAGAVPQNCYVRLTPGLREQEKTVDKRRRISAEQGQYFAIDANGNYSAENLQPGDYSLSVEFNQQDSLHKQNVHLTAGENLLDVTVDERCTLTVTVDLAPELKNKEGVSISISRSSREGGKVARYAKLGKSNSADFAFLPEGEYYVAAYDQDGTQSYATTIVNRGSNAVSLSLGPPNCVKVTDVAAGYQAAEAGMQVGDLIIEYNGVAIGNLETLIKEVQATSEGDSVSMMVVRNGMTMSLRLKGGRIGISGDNFRR